MILGVLDFETTGTDVLQDRVFEVGKILYTTGQKRVIESEGFLVKADRPIPKEVENLTGVSNAAMNKFGYDDHDSLMGILEWLKKLDVLAGHNINQFDWEVLKNWATRYRMIVPPLTLIDTMWDLPGVKGRKLKHMCADDDYLLTDAHEALTDCHGTLKLIEKRIGDLDKIIERAKSPLVVLQSLQDRDHNDLVKDRDALWNQIGGSFHWNADHVVWWKAVKEMDVEEIAKRAPFDVTIRRDLDIRQLWS